MKADRAVEEVEWVLGIGGIEVKTGVEIGKDITFEDLEKKHDAVFFGAGLGTDTKLGCPGEDLAGVYGAVDWIERMKLGTERAEVKHAVVVGGGNTSLDAVREAKGLGAERVTMLYRGNEEKMSGYHHEWKAAQTEDIHAEWHSIATKLTGNGKVEKVHCQKLDANKKPIAGSDFVIDAELVLIAIGQAKLGQLLSKLEGIKIESGRVVTDEHGCTGRKGWFAGGDCRNGGKEVVNAAAEGKAAARAIHTYLTGAKHG